MPRRTWVELLSCGREASRDHIHFVVGSAVRSQIGPQSSPQISGWVVPSTIMTSSWFVCMPLESLCRCTEYPVQSDWKCWLPSLQRSRRYCTYSLQYLLRGRNKGKERGTRAPCRPGAVCSLSLLFAAPSMPQASDSRVSSAVAVRGTATVAPGDVLEASTFCSSVTVITVFLWSLLDRGTSPLGRGNVILWYLGKVSFSRGHAEARFKHGSGTVQVRSKSG